MLAQKVAAGDDCCRRRGRSPLSERSRLSVRPQLRSAMRIRAPVAIHAPARRGPARAERRLPIGTNGSSQVPRWRARVRRWRARLWQMRLTSPGRIRRSGERIKAEAEPITCVNHPGQSVRVPQCRTFCCCERTKLQPRMARPSSAHAEERRRRIELRKARRRGLFDQIVGQQRLQICQRHQSVVVGVAEGNTTMSPRRPTNHDVSVCGACRLFTADDGQAHASAYAGTPHGPGKE